MSDSIPPMGHEDGSCASPRPWLAIIGIGEDGLHGLTPAARTALATAEHVFGGKRHLALANVGARGRAWPVPFDLAPVLVLRGRPVAILASGDPFWFGAGGSIAQHLEPGEWRSFAAPSAFSLAASRLGWRLEATLCRGLHATGFDTLLPDLKHGMRLIVTLRDGPAAGDLARWLTAKGWGASRLVVMQALGGPDEACFDGNAIDFDANPIAPVMAAIECIRTPHAIADLPLTPGLPDACFYHDGQITKAPIRAMTLAALAPHKGQVLWDLGAGSGSVSVEWCRAGGRAVAVETRADRCAHINRNIRHFGLAEQMSCHYADSCKALHNLPEPDAVFVGGGFSSALFSMLCQHASGARLVVNAVTLETQALISGLHEHHGGTLTRIDIAQTARLGRGRAWQPARSLMQWVGVCG